MLARLRILLAAALLASTTSASAQGWAVPATFRDHRIFVSARPVIGPPVVFYTDSGGGFDAITTETVDRLHLESAGELKEGEQTYKLIAFPKFVEHDGIPKPKDDKAFDGNLVSVDAKELASFAGDVQGFLGNRWFAHRIWELDYLRGTMRVLTVAKPVDATHRVALGFKTDEHGDRAIDFPRITVTIDGEPLELLFDTGATLRLSETSASQFGRKPGEGVGGAFIVKSTFDRWVARHSDWRVIPAGDALGSVQFSLIEVPRVTIAGLTVGPVWFALRPDENFGSEHGMSSMMDRPIVGAIGGSAFRYFRITIDYPGAVAWFETPRAGS